MWSANRFRRQAAACAAMAQQTDDQESRQRYLWLEQTFLRFAEMDNNAVGEMVALSGANEIERGRHDALN